MFNKEDLLAIANTTMPYGRYEGFLLIDLPEEYLLWFKNKGFPDERLGLLMALCLEIKIEGLDYLIQPLKDKK